jgi:F-type H+-transporting ATPase subunit epsilon
MADDSLFSVRLVTPERVLISDVTSEVILRTGEGDITFLAGSAPIVGTVEPGVVRVAGVGDQAGEVHRVAVHGGFVQVEQHVVPEGSDAELLEGTTTGTRVTILAAVAEPADEIDVERARVAHDAAEARVAELSGAAAGRPAATGDEVVLDPELVEAQAALVRSEVRLETVEAVSAGSATA